MMGAMEDQAARTPRSRATPSAWREFGGFCDMLARQVFNP